MHGNSLAELDSTLRDPPELLNYADLYPTIQLYLALWMVDASMCSNSLALSGPLLYAALRSTHAFDDELSTLPRVCSPFPQHSGVKWGNASDLV